jgi:aminobenzoyl-glutamate utilization protein B
VGSAVGAVAAARLLRERGRQGTIVYWGCPAEEALAGKVYMARDGAFRGLDACLTWHPSDRAVVSAAGDAALDSLTFEFYGQTAHGAYAQAGRSALDGAMLTDVAANYLREHVPDNVRIHSVLPDGGRAPNVVPEYAKIWYYVRGKDRAEVEGISRRLILCAKGAATATETKLKVTRLTGVYSRLRNQPLAELVRDNLLLIGPPRPTASDRRRVKALGKKPDFDVVVRKDIPEAPSKASTDQDNVSWLAPLACFGMVCVSKGVRGHNREYAAHSNLPFAHRGMLRAAEVLAAVAWDLYTDAARLRRVRAEFARGVKGFRYDPLIRKGQRPPVPAAKA